MAFKVLPDADLLQVITDGDMSSNVLGPPFNLRQRLSAAIQLVWTGNPVGPFSIQGSIDHVQDTDGTVQVVGNWFEIPISALISASGSPDDAYIELNEIAAPYIRVVYASVSGAGTLQAYISAKGG